METLQIILNIRRRAAELIVEDIIRLGSAPYFNLQTGILRVKTELDIDLKESNGRLVFAL